MTTISKILIANRGEIAVRVIKTAAKLGYQTVAVYSDADKDSLAVRLADEACHIGGSVSAESYLNIDNIIQAAKSVSADAIHPGYGFLSENAQFAKACAENAIVFIGPSAEVIHQMGNKAEAKIIMEKADVPCIPGYNGADQSVETLVAEAKNIGFPLLIKAAAGGGGRGMRFVTRDNELASAIESAKSEALSAFGNDHVIIEKAITKAHHVELQVFADAHGNVVHLGERDCSMQRRHQKVIEEAPSPIVTPVIRESMGRAAVNAAKAINYRGAGTVEFLLEPSGHFYFLEMNTRLQVEHPVTEMITGLDLVEWQLKVAAGAKLPLNQDQIRFNGHAVEVRLYAEDPANNFMPQTGKIYRWRTDEENNPHVRCDHGIIEGQTISPFYDPMIAKVIVWAEQRDDACRILSKKLADLNYVGPVTNQRFLRQLLADPNFLAGNFSTHYIDQDLAEIVGASPEENRRFSAIAALLLCQGDNQAWASTGVRRQFIQLNDADNESYEFALSSDRNSQFHIREQASQSETQIEVIAINDGILQAIINGVRQRLQFAIDKDKCLVSFNGQQYRFERHRAQAGASAHGDPTQIIAPTEGRIVKIHVGAGDDIAEGDTLLVIEAMKIEHHITSRMAGKIEQVNVGVDQQVSPNQLLAVIGE